MVVIIPADAGYIPGYKNINERRMVNDSLARKPSAEWTIASCPGKLLSEIITRANNINDIWDTYCEKMTDEATEFEYNAILCLKFNCSNDFDVIIGKVADGLEAISEERRFNQFR